MEQAKADKSLGGKLVVRWELDGQGKVQKALIKKDTIKNQKLNDCLIVLISGIPFEKPQTPHTVSIDYPFVFSPSKKTPSN